MCLILHPVYISGDLNTKLINSNVYNIVQTGSGAQQAYYPMGTGGSFPGGKATGA
jgi:hypothetical protein